MDLPPAGSSDGRGALRGLALCAGAGGLELGVTIAEPGYQTVGYVERDAFAASLLVARMADAALCDAPVWNDLSTFDARPWRGIVDLVTAGYPCQPFSFAGRRRGEADPRHLWPHVARVVGECEPEWVFLENVPGHLSLGFDRVAAELQEMGYRVEAGVFSAAEAGAPHWRERLFVLAHAHNRHGWESDRCEGDPDRVHLRAGARSDGVSGVSGHGSEKLVAALPPRPCDGMATGSESDLPLFAPTPCDFEAWDAILSRRPDLEPALWGMGDGVAYRVERSFVIGNGVCPMAAAIAWSALREAHSSSSGVRP